MAKATKGKGKTKGSKGTKGSESASFAKAVSNVSGSGSKPKTLSSGKKGSKVQAGKGTKQSGKLANGSASRSGKSGTFAKAANNVGKGGKKKSGGSKKRSGKGKEVAGFMKDPTNPEPKLPSKNKGKKGNAGRGGADGNGGAAGKAGKAGKGRGKIGGADGNGGAAGKAGKGKSNKGKKSQVTTPQKPVFSNKPNGPMNIPEGAKRGTAKVDTGQMKKKAQEAEKGFMSNVTPRKDVKAKGDMPKSMQNTKLDKSVSDKLKNPQESKDQNNPATAGFVR